MRTKARESRGVRIWVAIVCAMIVAMVAVGGVTRLTGSGLSIVVWKPIMGVIPPLTREAWEEAFAKYREFPQYRLVNQGMTLSEFKCIFFWEYLHRLLGRLLGVVFLLPWITFVARGQLVGATRWRLAAGFVLGGLQGALGWFMVKSGLVDRPSVSHYRLAAHLGLALVVLAYLFRVWLDIMPADPEPRTVSPRMRRGIQAILGLLSIQIFYGALTAGLKAGFSYNTFPKMNDEWVPSGLLFLSPAWVNFFENASAVQFAHRLLAWGLVTFAGAYWWYARRVELSPWQRLSVNAVAAAVALQFLLGVATILLVVPVSVAVMHQVGAVVLLICVLWAAHSMATRAR